MTETKTFDEAMKKILAVSKPEMQRRIEADKVERESDPEQARIRSAMKRPSRRPEL